MLKRIIDKRWCGEGLVMRNWLAKTVAVEHRTPESPSPSPNNPMGPSAMPQFLWIDGVGGYRICLGEEWVIGQAIPGNQVDLTILGDLSRRALALRRSGRDYFLQPWQDVRINQQPVDRPALLQDGSEVTIGHRVQLSFHLPNPWSSSAVLKLLSNHRWQPSVDGVILLADSIVLGPMEGSHIVCPFWNKELVIYRDGNKLFCRSSYEVQLNQQIRSGEFELHVGDKIRSEDLSFGLE
jgi:hypothetical protein